jgi:excisionase family DNA binding protein
MTHDETAYPALLTVNEAASPLAISRPSVYRLRSKGQLASYRVGDRLRFRQAGIEAYLERNKEPAASP